MRTVHKISIVFKMDLYAKKSSKRLVHKYVTRRRRKWIDKEPIKRSILLRKNMDRSISAEEWRVSAGCGDHTYKTYDRRVWSSCVPSALFSLPVSSLLFSPMIPATRRHHQSDSRWCFRREATGPAMCELKSTFHVLFTISTLEFWT